jgi:glycosyltransferase involved in cell wall biosynthesis
MSRRDIVRSIRLIELPLRLGLLWQFADMRRGARYETRILSAADGFLGRTDWDEAYARQHNPRAPYFRVGEILRPQFRATRWSLDACDRHTLIYTNAGHPLRGTPNLLAAAAILRHEFPDLRLRLAGVVSQRSGYGRFLRRRIRDLKLTDCVEFLGYLDGDAMAGALTRAHAFVISSYMENSPNSLAEAMTVGMPCVASSVGGIPSMVDHGRTGFLYPVDDIQQLAAAIRRIFRDDQETVRIGAAAREVAGLRHDPATVTDQLLAAYEKVLKFGAAG